MIKTWKHAPNQNSKNMPTIKIQEHAPNQNHIHPQSKLYNMPSIKKYFTAHNQKSKNMPTVKIYKKGCLHFFLIFVVFCCYFSLFTLLQMLWAAFRSLSITLPQLSHSSILLDLTFFKLPHSEQVIVVQASATLTTQQCGTPTRTLCFNCWLNL